MGWYIRELSVTHSKDNISAALRSTMAVQLQRHEVHMRRLVVLSFLRSEAEAKPGKVEAYP